MSLASTLDHEHDVTCIPCDRCTHMTCEHHAGFDDCQATGCECPRWLAVDDCGPCNGTGVLTHPDIDDEVRCPTCGGSGVNYERRAS